MRFTPEARARLGQAVKEQRERLHLSQSALQPRGGPSSTKVRQVEKAAGDEPSGLTLSALDTALGWGQGRAMSILTGAQIGTAVNHVPAAVVAAIEADTALLPEAKAHLLNQYELLLRLQAGPADQARRQQDRRDTADEDRRRMDEQLNAEAAADMAEADPSPEVGEPTQIAPRNRRSRHLR